MDAGTGRPEPRIDVSSLEVGGRYRVDWRHERLRRTFRITGTLTSVEGTPGAHDPNAETQTWLAFEVKPRFGPPSIQRVDAATLRSIEPA